MKLKNLTEGIKHQKPKQPEQNIKQQSISHIIFITSMSSIDILTKFYDQASDQIYKNIQVNFQNLCSDLEKVQLESLSINQDHGLINGEKYQQNGEIQTNLNKLELHQSRTVDKQLNNISQSEKIQKRRRIKQIEQEKKKIVDELKQLDEEIQEIKGGTNLDNGYKKRQKIHKDQNAQKQAENLVKELKSQRKQIQQRKRLEMEKSLQQMQKEQQQRRKIREQQISKQKQQRRQAILQRMQQQKRRKQQRKIIQSQSNQLIAKLKKQQELEKQALASIAPAEAIDAQQKKRLIEKKPNFDFREIEQHDRKYRELKQRSMKEKQQRSQSLKVNNKPPEKYSRNVWIERIQEQDQRKKVEERDAELKRKSQLQKRLKYGELVKNIFLPKKKENELSSAHAEQKQQNVDEVKSSQNKPKTPQNAPSLPKIKIASNKTQNSKMFNEGSLNGIRNSKKIVIDRTQKLVKQFDANEQESQKNRKIRQLQLRKQTKDRLKKLQSQNPQKNNQSEKPKYKNYLAQVKVKKDEQNDWKKIMSNDKLTQEQKYQQLIKKAGDLQAKAKKKQDKGLLKQADQDAVNLYIGSIQAKLALLQKF